MTTAPADPPRLVVTLLHGTFARRATWVDPDGAIAGALTARFGAAVAIEQLRWSGANSFGGRRQAAELLRQHLLKPRPGLDTAAHVVVAHSHAGNVVASATQHAAVADRLAGVVTLSTPFIVARPRNLGHVGLAVGQALVIWLVLALYWMASTWLGPLLGANPAAELAPGHKLALIAALAVGVELPGLVLVARWRRSSARLLAQLAPAPLPAERWLILRAMADEASALITVLQFPSVIATLIFGRLAGATDAVLRWCERLVQRPLVALGACLLFLVASMLPAGLVMWLTGAELLMWIVLIACMCLSYGPIVFLLLRNRHLAAVTASGCLAIPLAPALLLLGLAAGLAYGWRFALANLDLDISVEATPVGEFTVTLLSPAAAGDPDRPGGLLHSTLYDDERAIQRIGDFIDTRLRLVPSPISP